MLYQLMEIPSYLVHLFFADSSSWFPILPLCIHQAWSVRKLELSQTRAQHTSLQSRSGFHVGLDKINKKFKPYSLFRIFSGPCPRSSAALSFNQHYRQTGLLRKLYLVERLKSTGAIVNLPRFTMTVPTAQATTAGLV